MGRGAGFKSDTTRHSWGERSRVGRGTWSWLLASPMTNTGTRTGKSFWGLQAGCAMAGFGSGKGKSDTAI